MQTQILWRVKMFEQQGYNWCWAACLQMILKYYQPKSVIKQCQIVARKYGETDCNKVFDKINKWAKAEFDKALTQNGDWVNLLQSYNYTIISVQDKKEYWKTITQAIDNQHPIVANMGFHYVVIFGYWEDVSTGKYFIYNNPKNSGFSIKKFESCGAIQIEEELLLIKQDQFATENAIASDKYQTKHIKVNKLKPFFDDNKTENTSTESIKVVTKIINITNNPSAPISLNIPPTRYDDILKNTLIRTFELCDNGEWKKVKMQYAQQQRIHHFFVDGKKITLDNKGFEPTKNALILPFNEVSHSVQFEKIIFQPFVFQFYHIKMSNKENDSKLIPILNYNIHNEDFKKGVAYSFNHIIKKLKGELKKRQISS